MDSEIKKPNTSRKAPRRWRLLLTIVAVVLCAGILYRFCNAELVPCTHYRYPPDSRRVLYSMYCMGYPSIDQWEHRWLDDAGRMSSSHIPIHKRWFPLLVDRQQQRLYEEDFTEKLPGNCYHSGIMCVKPTLRILNHGAAQSMSHQPTERTVALFDASKTPMAPLQTFTLHDSSDTECGMLFTHGTRMLFIQTQGPAEVFENGQSLGLFGGKKALCRWGEDGTAWMQDGNSYHLLHWQQGKPELMPFPVQLPVYPYTVDDDALTLRVDFHTSIMELPIAAWENGRLVAATQEHKYPKALIDKVERLAQLCHIQLEIPRIGRTLTFYRDGRKVGTKTVPISENNVPAEHLAFTADGKYLSWVINDGRSLQMYYFATGL